VRGAVRAERCARSGARGADRAVRAERCAWSDAHGVMRARSGALVDERGAVRLSMCVLGEDMDEVESVLHGNAGELGDY
jgi:hypothetical protein